MCGADSPTCSVLHGSTYDHRNANSLLHALMSRECTCYCQVCACKEFAKVLGKKCKLKCPACQRVVDRIIVKEAADDERVPALRRCKSAVIVREKLEDENLGMHRVVVPIQRESSSQTVAQGGQSTQREFVVHRCNKAITALKNFVDAASDKRAPEVQLQQELSSQRVAEKRQNTQRSLTLRRYVQALSAFKKLVDAISNYCGAKVQLQQEPSSQNPAKGRQNAQTYAVMGLCEKAMSALEKTAEELLGKRGAEIPGHRESTSQPVAEGKQHKRRGDLRKRQHQKTMSTFLKLKKKIKIYSTVRSSLNQALSDQTVVEDASTLRKVPLLHRCDSAMFSWDKQCPLCQMTRDVNQESE